MELYSINAGNFRLDGGAMFGVVPKSLWQKLIPADSNNTIPLCTRCLLIQDGNKLILIDTGMGDKQSEKFFGYYYLWGEDNLSYSMKKKGFHPDDVTDVFLTHLHFDHCGGSIKKTSENSFVTTFKNATYWSNKKHSANVPPSILSPYIKPYPIAQKVIVATLISMKFFMAMLPEFLVFVIPASNKVNPACMKKTRIPERRIHKIVKSVLTSTALLTLAADNKFVKIIIFNF